MQATADRLDFAPPAEPAAARAFVLAVVAHLLLLVALTWGVHWQKETKVAAEAELWARMPDQAPPPPPPAPAVPQPPPAPIAKPAPPPVTKEPDIVQERERKRREEQARREEEERKALEAKKKKEQEEVAKREQAAKEKAAQERKKQEAKAAQEKKEAEQLAQLRDEQMERMRAMAASTGKPGAAASPKVSPNYAGRIAGRIKPNIVFTDVISGNPAAVVDLRVAPDGTIISKKLVKSSGVNAWDEAVLRAIDRTGSIPRDTDGSVVPSFEIEFRPKD